MKIRPLRFGRLCASMALALAIGEGRAAGPVGGSGLTHLVGPQGGQIVFGHVTGPATLPAAMGTVLSSVHAQFGARPEVGRVFELKGSGSIAVHFSVAPPNRPPVAGMVIVTPDANGGFEAGIVSDDRNRLQASFNPMLKTLFDAWHPASADGAEGSRDTPVAARAAAPLQPSTLPDRTASVGLPDGFRVLPNSGGGTIYASGPRGERLALGDTLLVIDTATPQGRQLQQQARGPLRNTSYAQNLYYPFGQPLAKTFVDLNRQQRELHRLPPAAIRVTSEEPMGAQGASRCTHLRGDVGPHDGAGPTVFDGIFCVSPPERSANSWLTVAYLFAVPVALADQERATMSAVVASFREDRAAIQRMANQLAAPGIAAIHEIGRQAAQRAADADATRIGMRQSYEARSNAQDRSSRAFSNYLRDQTVVVDRDNNAHGTVWNATADSMVRNDPRRFAYVDTPNFWKGVDY